MLNILAIINNNKVIIVDQYIHDSIQFGDVMDGTQLYTTNQQTVTTVGYSNLLIKVIFYN